MENGKEFVANEPEVNSKWFFDREKEQYYKLDCFGNETNRVNGTFLPNPAVLKKSYEQLYKIGASDRNDAHIATYKMWIHWNGYINNKL